MKRIKNRGQLAPNPCLQKRVKAWAESSSCSSSDAQARISSLFIRESPESFRELVPSLAVRSRVWNWSPRNVGDAGDWNLIERRIPLAEGQSKWLSIARALLLWDNDSIEGTSRIILVTVATRLPPIDSAMLGKRDRSDLIARMAVDWL